MQVFMAPSTALALATQKDVDVVLTVEAEYGSTVVEGRLYTAAHHQPVGSPYAGTHVGGVRPSPCNDPNIPVVTEGVILVSHVDLDTFGGLLRAMGRTELFTPSTQGFWDLAEFVDTNGPHKIALSGASNDDVRALYAFWAWAASNPRFPRDQISDITELVQTAGDILHEILLANSTYRLQAGDAYRANEDALNASTFLRLEDGVIVRQGESFCNHLYSTPDGVPAQAVVARNTNTGSITISLAEPIPGFSCRMTVQRLWGPEAGGHDGIAGSPREKQMTEADLSDAVASVKASLNN